MSFFLKPSAGPGNTIDSFEDGDNTDSWYAWTGSIFSASSAYSALDGSWVSEVNTTRSASEKGNANINENLPNYPRQGDQWRYHFKFTNTVDSDFVCYWSFEDITQPFEDSWEYRINGSNDSTELEANDNNGSAGDTSFAASSVTWSQDVWYEIDIHFFSSTSTNDVDVYVTDLSTNTQVAHDSASTSTNEYTKLDYPNLAYYGTSGCDGIIDHIHLV